MIVNIVGSALLGLLTGWMTGVADVPTIVKVVSTGFCGGFTTFSSACVELATLTREGRGRAGAVLAVATAIACCTVALLGIVVGRALA